MTESEPTADEIRRAWLRELLARSEPNSPGRGIFARKPSSTDDPRSTE